MQSLEEHVVEVVDGIIDLIQVHVLQRIFDRRQIGSFLRPRQGKVRHEIASESEIEQFPGDLLEGTFEIVVNQQSSVAERKEDLVLVVLLD